MGQCRLCDGKLFADPLLELKGMPRAAQFYPTPAELKSDTGIDLNIYQCSDCELVQLNREPVDYFREVITAASLSEKNRAARLADMKNFVQRFDLKGKKALEVGCARGEMLDVLKEAGLEAVGIEASQESVTTGRAVGRRIIQGYIGDLEIIEAAPYSAFVCLNYFEHLPQPGNIIQRIYRNTTPDAVGFVTVPNLEYLVKSKCFYEFVADHLSYFTKKTLTHAFESNGFSVLECQSINEDNDILVVVQKKKPISFKGQYKEVTDLCADLKKTVQAETKQKKKVAVWGAGHRTLALLALSGLNEIEFIVDSAKFKQGKLSPVLHKEIVPPDRLRKGDVDLVIVMVPGIYPNEVLKTIRQMNLDMRVAILRENKIEFEM